MTQEFLSLEFTFVQRARKEKNEVMAKAESIQQENTQDTQEESSQAKLTYDPDQDPAEKRQIRRDLRKLLSEINGKLNAYFDLLNISHLCFVCLKYLTRTTEQKANIRNVKISDIQEGLAKGNSLFHKGQFSFLLYSKMFINIWSHSEGHKRSHPRFQVSPDCIRHGCGES